MKPTLFIGGWDVSLIGRICSKDGIRNGLTVDPCLPPPSAASHSSHLKSPDYVYLCLCPLYQTICFLNFGFSTHLNWFFIKVWGLGNFQFMN